MIGAKVVLVDKTSDQQLPDPVTTIASPAPAGSLRIRLPATVKPGDYYLKALNGHGASIAQSVEFYVELIAGFPRVFAVSPPRSAN